MRPDLRVVVGICLSCACGGEDNTGTDGGDRDGEATDGGNTAAVAPPGIPWLAEGFPPIALDPCPDGWRAVAGDGPTACEPYPEGGALDCPAGEAHFPGEPGCAPVGAACPGGDFAEGLPTDVRVVHVQPGATGGDGTAAAPYGRIAEFSLGGLPVGAVLALSRGDHEGPARLARGLVLWGACAGATTLSTSTTSDTEAVVTLSGTGGGLRNLTISSSPRRGVLVSGPGVEGDFEGLVIADVEFLGVDADNGGRVVARTLHVRDTRGRTGLGTFGRGFSVVRGSSADVSRAVIERNRDEGVFAAANDTTLALADAVIRDTEEEEASRSAGRGLEVRLAAVATAERVLIERNQDVGAYLLDPDSMLAIRDAVIRDTEPHSTDVESGIGVSVQGGAAVIVERALVEHNRGIGMLVQRGGSNAIVTDLVLRDTRSWTDMTSGRGLSAQYEAHVEVTRGLFERNLDLGVFAHGSGVTIALADVAVHSTASRASDGDFGRGLNVAFGASAVVDRALFESNADDGVFASEPGTRVTLSDVVVDGTLSRTLDGSFGRGMTFQRGVVVEGARLLVERNHDVGLFAFGAGTEVDVVDTAVRETLPRGCAVSMCSDTPAGHGVGSYEEARLAMLRFEVTSASLCGVHVADRGEMDLEGGRIHDHPIGVCVQVDGYDPGRLMREVVFFDNETNLQTTSLPVPESASGVAPPP